MPQNVIRAPTLHERSSSWPRTTCASTNIPGFNPAEMPAATAARASPIVLRRTPPRKPSRWFIHHVSTPAATSRRSPSGVGRDITSPSTATITREMPVQPDPHAPPTRTSRFNLDRAGCRRRRIPASSGCAPTRPKRNLIHPRHQPGIDVAASSSRRPTSTFGVTPTTMFWPIDCTSDTPTVDVVRACTLRPTSSRLVGARHCRLSSRRDRKFPAGSTQGQLRSRKAPRPRRYPLRSQHFAGLDEPNWKRPASNTTLTIEPVADACGVPIDRGRIVRDRDEGAGHARCARVPTGLWAYAQLRQRRGSKPPRSGPGCACSWT